MLAQEKSRARGPIPELPATGLLKIDDVLRFVPVSRATWFRGVAQGIFPQPIKLGTLSFWHARAIRYLLDHGIHKASRARRRKTRATAH